MMFCPSCNASSFGVNCDFCGCGEVLPAATGNTGAMQHGAERVPCYVATSVADGDALALSAIGGGEWMPGEPRPIAPAPAEPPGTFSAGMHTHLTGIDATLAERGTRYGEFIDQARIAVRIKDAMASGRNWVTLAPDQRECLDMLANKMARILNGDPNYHDSWHDIVGYAKLVADRIAA